MYNLFSEFFNGFDMYPEITTHKEQLKCPNCGRTYNDFRHTGKLGCSKCYDVFRPQLNITMRQIHQNPTHAGKIPSHSGEAIKKKRRYEELKQQLSQAVKNEDAKLQKEIREIENSN